MSFAGIHAHNYSLYAIPAGWALAMAPHFYAIALFNKERAPGTAKWDNSAPMSSGTDGVKAAKLSPHMTDRYHRAEAANVNSHITLPLFAVAILAGNFARLTNRTLNLAAAGYLASRIAYVYLYVNGTSPLGGNLRSAAYLSGIGSIFTLLIKAGNRLF